MFWKVNHYKQVDTIRQLNKRKGKNFEETMTRLRKNFKAIPRLS